MNVDVDILDCMKVVATICSRKKSEDENLLPAQERYLGAHIEKVKRIAIEQDAPFYILSGLYGFMPADMLIPTYDYLLVESAVDPLITIVADQMKADGITEVLFYTEDNPNWQPYHRAIESGASTAGALFTMKHLT